MSRDDFVQMLVNLSTNMPSVIRLLAAFAYLTGVMFIIAGVLHLKNIGSGGASQQGPAVGLAYFVGGTVLLFLPSAVAAISNSTFGSSNVLQYAPVNALDINGAMTLVVQTAGLIWFIRGVSLLVSASHPGGKGKSGSKGMVFLFAGVLALNFQMTVSVLDTLIGELSALSIKVKNIFGY